MTKNVPPNFVGRLFDWLIERFQKVPIISTWFAALFLSSVWTVSWFVVFFFSTWFLKLETNAKDFVNLFWLSIAAEAIIRWAENTNFIAGLSKPYDKNARGDNLDYNWRRASALFSTYIAAMLIMNNLMHDLGLAEPTMMFTGPNGPLGFSSLSGMVLQWHQLTTDTAVVIFLFLGTLARATIYKRHHTVPADIDGDNT